jgi:hypothetical protein
MEGVNVGMVEDHASPPGPLALGRLRDEIEIAPAARPVKKRSGPRLPRLQTAYRDFPSMSA